MRQRNRFLGLIAAALLTTGAERVRLLLQWP